MIDEIQVENLALIKSATLTPCAGLTVLTGETGAGKTALLSACKLLLGERSDKSAIRDGEDSLTVSGRFFFRDACESGESVTAAAADSPACERELVATRRVSADGRSRITINGRMASANELASCVAPSIDLCGQHEHQRLLKPANHVTYLDAWAAEGISPALQAYQQAFAEAAQAQAEWEKVQQAQASSSAALDEARFVVKRITEIDPHEGEYEELLDKLNKAENAETLAVAASSAYEALSGESAAAGEQGSALDALNAAIYALDNAARFDASLADFSKALRDAVYVVEDVAADVRAYRDQVEYDPEQLVFMQQRVRDMQGLLRSYGPRMEDVFSARDAAADLISLVDDSSARVNRAQAQLAHAEEQLAAAADALDKVRAKQAPRFAAAVTQQMGALCMGKAQLVCESTRLERKAWTKMGPSALEFLFKPGADMSARPLARIASGGEVSRMMLALKVVLGANDRAETLVFDEVDAGVGGATALALAEVLAQLAQTHQVLVVTHLAQVAVRAQAHFVVEKTNDALPETSICAVEGAQRVDEIARMLSGDASTAARVHAAEMLAQYGVSDDEAATQNAF